MKRITISLVLAFAFGVFSAGVWACPGEATCTCGTAKTAADKPSSCGGGAATVADGKSSCGKGCGGSCDKFGNQPSSCGGGVTTVSDSNSSCGASCSKGCGKSCNKSCGQGSATLTSGKAGKSSCSGGQSVAKSNANIEVVMASFPSMKYRVSEKITSCARSAEAIAEKSGEPIRFLVGDYTFENKGEAKLKLASLLERDVETLKTVQFVVDGKGHHCPTTAKKVAAANGGKIAYRVGGFDFDSKGKADSVAELVSEKLVEVKMTYKVGDESFCCDKMAGMTAKKTGKPMHYVVEGEETSCDKTAKLWLAEALVRAAVLTAAAVFAS